jgi:hypothetical protein
MEPIPPAEPPVESDDRFPSGPWTGFFLQPGRPGRHWMELILTFRPETIRGEGRDFVGEFLIRGRYNTRDGKCWWSKRYLGKHDVAYQGFNEGKGIWGVWSMDDPPFRGGFHIWPVGRGDPTGQALAAEADVPELVGAATVGDTEPLAGPL